MGEKLDLRKYPEGLKVLAEKLDLPFDPDKHTEREDYVFDFINFIITL